MCGRYILVQKAEVIAKAFNIAVPRTLPYQPSFNIGAGNSGLVITADKPREAQLFTFGFTPHWAQKPMYLINARAEGDHNKEQLPDYSGAKGIITKPAFRKAIRSQRCLVIADAFIEGTTREKLRKPYLIYLQERKPFAFAGIWDSWTNPASGDIVNSFAIITTVANELLRMIPHHRSPVILEKSMEQIWLTGKHLDDVTWMLKPYPSEKMNGYPIAEAIRDPRADEKALIMPVGERLRKEDQVKTSQDLRLQGMGRNKFR